MKKSAITPRQASAAAKYLGKYLRGVEVNSVALHKAQRTMLSYLRQRSARLSEAAVKKNFRLLKRSYGKEFMDLTRGI